MLNRQIGFLPRQVRGHAHFLEPRLAALPAEMDEILAGRADDVRHALDQVALAVAVIVDGVRHVFGRHHLGLAEFARPGADHLLGAQVAALDQAQRIEQMTAEHVGAAAIIGQRGERFDRMILALAGAEIALQSPEGRDHRGRDAKVLVFAREQRLVLLDLRSAAGQAPAGQHLVGDLEEVLREELLAAVDVDDALVEHEIGRSGGDCGRRNSLGERLLLEGGEPRVEAAGVATIGLGQCRGRHADQQRRQQGRSPSHCSASSCLSVSPNCAGAGDRSPARRASCSSNRNRPMLFKRSPSEQSTTPDRKDHPAR